MTNDLSEEDDLMQKITKHSPADKYTVTSKIISGPQSIIAAAAAKVTMPGNTYEILMASRKPRSDDIQDGIHEGLHKVNLGKGKSGIYDGIQHGNDGIQDSISQGTKVTHGKGNSGIQDGT